MAPTQSTPAELTASATGATAAERNRKRALAGAKNDAKALWDALRTAAEKGQDRSVADDLINAARQRLALVDAALKAIG